MPESAEASASTATPTIAGTPRDDADAASTSTATTASATDPATAAVALATTPTGTPTPFVERRRATTDTTPPTGIPPHPLRRRSDAVAPSFALPRTAPAVASRQAWIGIGTVAALSLLLVLQLLLAQRESLAQSARWRPVVSALCGALGCDLPAWREPSAFTMLGREVRAHPTAPGALLINASFRNDARWPQRWPQLLLTLSDVDGRVVGARVFGPRDYLSGKTQDEIAPGQTAAVSLAVVEPAPGIVAFSFDFR